jgi:glycosyltransferase involved in cell wall biosynthesis
MRKYRIGFAMYDGKGFATHNQNIRKYVQRDPELEIVWTPLGSGQAPAAYRHAPALLRNQLALLNEAYPVIRHWQQLDAIVVEDAPRLLALLILKKLLFDQKQRAPILVLYQDYAPLHDTNLLAWYGYHTSRSSLPGRLSYTVQRWAVQQADCCVLFSHWAGAMMLNQCGVPAERVFVVKPGADLELWAPCPVVPAASGRVRMLFVGGDFTRKGGDLLLSVFREHFTESAELHLVTKQPQGDLPANVYVYTGINSNDARLRELYAQCDLFVLPTRADFSSLASIEAMAVGRPVVLTHVGGTADIVRDGETGFLIKPDDPEALRDRLQRLIADAALRQRMGAAGRAVAECEFSIESNVADLVSLIKAAVDQRDRLVRHGSNMTIPA